MFSIYATTSSITPLTLATCIFEITVDITITTPTSFALESWKQIHLNRKCCTSLYYINMTICKKYNYQYKHKLP